MNNYVSTIIVSILRERNVSRNNMSMYKQLQLYYYNNYCNYIMPQTTVPTYLLLLICQIMNRF